MTTITTFQRGEHALVSSKVLVALKTLETELGVKFDTRGGLLGMSGGVIKLGVEITDAGNGKSGAQVEYERHAAMFGMKPEWFGVPFFSQGTEYKISGVNIGSPKFRFMVERTHDGRQFKATLDMCKRGLEAAVAAGRIAA